MALGLHHFQAISPTRTVLRVIVDYSCVGGDNTALTPVVLNQDKRLYRLSLTGLNHKFSIDLDIWELETRVASSVLGAEMGIVPKWGFMLAAG